VRRKAFVGCNEKHLDGVLHASKEGGSPYRRGSGGSLRLDGLQAELAAKEAAAAAKQPLLGLNQPAGMPIAA